MDDIDLSKKWDRLQKAAKKLGVTDGNFLVWKHRGSVPAKWRLKLHTECKIPLTLFNQIQRGT